MNNNSIRYKHFIITLFNLPLWKLDKNNRPTLTKEWLENRLNIFEKYCIPSVMAQSNHNFIWLCLCDKSTPEPYMSRIKSYREKFDLFSPHFLDLSGKEVNGVRDLTPIIRPIIKKYITKDDQFVVSTNLDNDDSIHSQMIEKLQSLIRTDSSNKLYSFNLGYQYFTDINLLFKMNYPHNHFLTLIEDSVSFTTIIPITHTSARKKFET